MIWTSSFLPACLPTYLSRPTRLVSRKIILYCRGVKRMTKQGEAYAKRLPYSIIQVVPRTPTVIDDAHDIETSNKKKQKSKQYGVVVNEGASVAAFFPHLGPPSTLSCRYFSCPSGI